MPTNYSSVCIQTSNTIGETGFLIWLLQADDCFFWRGQTDEICIIQPSSLLSAADQCFLWFVCSPVMFVLTLTQLLSH